MTPVEHCACVASADLGLIALSAATLSARSRAGVMRGGRAAPSTSVTPKRGLTGSKAARALIIMRTTMPSGAKV